MASAMKTPSTVNGSGSLHNKMCFIAKFRDLHEEKVVHYEGNAISMRANEPTSSEVLDGDFLRESNILNKGTVKLSRYSTDKVSSKGVSRRILHEDFLERYGDQSQPSTQFRAFKIQCRTKHSVGTRPVQRNDEMLVKTNEDKIAPCLKDREFELSSDKRSTEAERIEKLFFRRERGNRDMKSKDVYGNLSWSSSPPITSKRKSSGGEKKEKTEQRKVQKNNEQLKIVVNNLVTAISYTFQNALALKQQQGEKIDKSFLTFFLRREARKMFLVKELIKELDAITDGFKCYKDDLKDGRETAESLHSLMCQDLKDPDDEGLEFKKVSSGSGKNRNYFRFILAFAITSCMMAVLGLAVVFKGNWFDIVAFIFLALVTFHMALYGFLLTAA